MTLRAMIDFWKHLFYYSKTLLFEVLEGIMSVLLRNIIQWANFRQLFALEWVHEGPKVSKIGANVT